MRISCVFTLLCLNLEVSLSQHEIIEIRYQIQEEVPIGTFVGNILDDSNLTNIHPNDVIKKLSFRFLRHPLNSLSSQQLQHSSEGFSLSTTTGVIRTSSRVDRDEICPVIESCLMRIDVAVQPVEFFKILRIVISIQDINDNYPVFPAPQAMIEILESANIGATFSLPSATDIDSPAHSVKKYRIVPQSETSKQEDNDTTWKRQQQQQIRHAVNSQTRNSHKFPFQLRESSKAGREGQLEVRLVLTRNLDRETFSSYEMVVEAIDGGDDEAAGVGDEKATSLTASILVRINVLDVNDNIPVFERESYDVKVREDVSAGSFIVGVKAHDRDVGFNGEIDYEFTSITENSHGSEFFMNSTTGEIFIRRKLDYEKIPYYRLTIVAQDRGPDPAPVTVPVSIFIEDVNDNAPEISIDTLSSHLGVAEVVESLAAGTFVAHVSVIDRDSGDNGNFECHLKMDGDEFMEIESFTLKVLLDSEFQIVTTRPLDREERSSYKLQIECKDLPVSPGNNVMVGRTSVIVNVGDVNDNDPEFDRSLYVAEIIENNYVGAVVLQISAVDRDLGKNSYVTYSLEDIDGYLYGYSIPIGSLMNIESTTGIIKALVSLDREISDEVRAIVVAKDGGQVQRSSSAFIRIAISDVNDEKPRFEQDSYDFEAMENEPPGTIMGRVFARDGDLGLNGQVFYQMEILHPASYPTPHSKSDTFDIDKQTGIITITHPLDREMAAIHQLMVKASDGSSPAQSSSVLVNIFVQDLNDNAPEFKAQLFANKTFQVSSASPVGFLVTQIMATDGDDGGNGHLVYDMESENDCFSIDGEVGAIYVSRSLKNEPDACHDVIVKASDQGLPPLSSLISICICINSSLSLTDVSSRVSARGGFLPHQNLTIVIILASVSSLVTIALICAICVLKKQEKTTGKDLMSKDNCGLQPSNESLQVESKYFYNERNFKNINQEYENARVTSHLYSADQ